MERQFFEAIKGFGKAERDDPPIRIRAAESIG
jgi:hypothetical protein